MGLAMVHKREIAAILIGLSLSGQDRGPAYNLAVSHVAEALGLRPEEIDRIRGARPPGGTRILEHR